jgi:hypothetical protein
LQKTLVRVLRTANDRHARGIERRIDDSGTPRILGKLPKKAVVPTALFLRNGLDSRRPVNVRRRRKGRVFCLGSKKHERAFFGKVEIFGRTVGEDRGCERSETLTEFDFSVYALPVVGIPRIGQNGTVSEGSWPEFHPSLEPADDLLFSKVFGDALEELGFPVRFMRNPRPVEVFGDFGIAPFRSPKNMGNFSGIFTRISQYVVPGMEGRASRSPGISGGRKHPCVAKNSFE